MPTHEEIKDMTGVLLGLVKETPGTMPPNALYLLNKLAAKIVDKEIAIVDLSGCCKITESYVVQVGDDCIQSGLRVTAWVDVEIGDDLPHAKDLRDLHTELDRNPLTYRIIKRTTFEEVVEI